MSLRRVNYRNKKTGVMQVLPRWYIRTKDHHGRRVDVLGFTDKAATQEFERKVERLVAARAAGSALDASLTGWIDALPTKHRERLATLGIIERSRLAASKPLGELAEDFAETLRSRDRSPKHIKLVTSRARSVIEGSGAKLWRDLNAIAVERYLKQRREAGLSAQSSNHLLTSVRQFCRWMVDNGLATEDPLRVLRPLNVRVDRRLERRALDVDEQRALIAATVDGPIRAQMRGPVRALLYRVALETGLRASEIKSLRVRGLDLEGATPTATVDAGSSKRRREDVVPLRPNLATALADHVRGMALSAPVFPLTKSWRSAEMLRADLELAGIEHVDRSGRTIDFHSLRHSFITQIAQHASPQAVQALARHSTPLLSYGRYAHVRRDEEREALGTLPELGGGTLVSHLAQREAL